MVKVNSTEIVPSHFPDRTQMLLNIEFNSIFCNGDRCFNFHWKYESDEELVTIMFLVKHFRNLYPNCHLNLIMPYIPNARMDRVKSVKEVFTLKWFCEIINSLEFDEVTVLDPHSHVSEALLNHVKIDSDGLLKVLDLVIEKTSCGMVYFPDEGSLKRYGDLSSFNGIPKLYGKKNRDWQTGRILGLEILSDEGNVEEMIKVNPSILMVDDIISYGGTFYYSALKLKLLGAKEINAYATHTENSVLDRGKGTFIKCLEDGTVNRLYTTDSLFSEKHDKICLIEK